MTVFLTLVVMLSGFAALMFSVMALSHGIQDDNDLTALCFVSLAVLCMIVTEFAVKGLNKLAKDDAMKQAKVEETKVKFLEEVKDDHDFYMFKCDLTAT